MYSTLCTDARSVVLKQFRCKMPILKIVGHNFLTCKRASAVPHDQR